MVEQKINDPRKQYTGEAFPKQYQQPPAVQGQMTPVPDCGETSYRGNGRLTGKKALITGGDSGIGRAAAIAYLREGADIAINYLPMEQPDAEEVQKIAQEAGRICVLLPADLKDESAARTLVDTAVQQLGGLDILVLNAGMQQAVEDIAEIDIQQVRDTFDTNIISMFYTVQQALKAMRPGACIITTTSVEAYDPSPTLLDYASTKAAIANFTKCLAKQLSKKGIRVNGVAPGPVWTPLQIAGGQPQEKIPTFGKSSLIGRAGQPVELADVYVFLASPESGFVTGQVYGVTGGKLID